ncbi:MAG: hypothetical protein ACO1OB_20910 [Archangium sp.]
MRALLIATSFLMACPQAPAPMPDGGNHTAVRPVRTDANPNIDVYAEISNDGVAADEQQLDVALGEPYPQVIDVGVEPAYVTRGCENGLKFGKERLLSLSQVNGDAATLSIVGERLHVELKHEGFVTVTLSGEIYDVMCLRGGELKTTLPSRHLVTMRVSRISKFGVTHVSQGGSRCSGTPLVLAAMKPTSFPWVSAHDSQGALFQPINARDPVQLTLRADAPIEVVESDVKLPPGRTVIELATTLPVEGLREIVLVEPSRVTSAEIELGVVRAYAKGNEWVRVGDGTSVQLVLPDEENTLAVRTSYVATSEGALCSTPAQDWFEATSSTPETCESFVGSSEEWLWQSVVKIIAPGECRATVKLRDTSLTWDARFTTN